jgi:hypothetical protein
VYSWGEEREASREMQGMWKQCGGGSHQADTIASFRYSIIFSLKNTKVIIVT